MVSPRKGGSPRSTPARGDVDVGLDSVERSRAPRLGVLAGFEASRRSSRGSRGSPPGRPPGPRSRGGGRAGGSRPGPALSTPTVSSLSRAWSRRIIFSSAISRFSSRSRSRRSEGSGEPGGGGVVGGSRRMAWSRPAGPPRPLLQRDGPRRGVAVLEPALDGPHLAGEDPQRGRQGDAELGLLGQRRELLGPVAQLGLLLREARDQAIAPCATSGRAAGPGPRSSRGSPSGSRASRSARRRCGTGARSGARRAGSRRPGQLVARLDEDVERRDWSSAAGSAAVLARSLLGPLHRAGGADQVFLERDARVAEPGGGRRQRVGGAPVAVLVAARTAGIRPRRRPSRPAAIRASSRSSSFRNARAPARSAATAASPSFVPSRAIASSRWGSACLRCAGLSANRGSAARARRAPCGWPSRDR